MRCPSDGFAMNEIERKEMQMFLHIKFKCPHCGRVKRDSFMNPNYKQRKIK